MWVTIVLVCIIFPCYQLTTTYRRVKSENCGLFFISLKKKTQSLQNVINFALTPVPQGTQVLRSESFSTVVVKLNSNSFKIGLRGHWQHLYVGAKRFLTGRNWTNQNILNVFIIVVLGIWLSLKHVNLSKESLFVRRIQTMSYTCSWVLVFWGHARATLLARCCWRQTWVLGVPSVHRKLVSRWHREDAEKVLD